jgi:hypothetical protein
MFHLIVFNGFNILIHSLLWKTNEWEKYFRKAGKILQLLFEIIVQTFGAIFLCEKYFVIL